MLTVYLRPMLASLPHVQVKVADVTQEERLRRVKPCDQVGLVKLRYVHVRTTHSRTLNVLQGWGKHISADWSFCHLWVPI